MNLNAYRVNDIRDKIFQAGFRPLDVLLVGATGVGKSSTLNALFGDVVAEVGQGVDPQTMVTDHYLVHDFLRIWDSPGLGDGKSADTEHAKKLIGLLNKTYTHKDGTWGFIDLVLVILDGSLRDMGTTYRLLEQVILPNIDPSRVLVMINQADMAMKGRHWDEWRNLPDSELQVFLAEKSSSVQARLLEATGLKIKLPVCYSALKGYHLQLLMDNLIEQIPISKRKMHKPF